MAFSRLVERFASRTKLPVQVSEVADALKDLHVCRDFYFWASDLDPSKVRGFVQVWDALFDDSGYDIRRFADVYYSKRDASDWQRFVACKEMIHCMDNPHFCVSTQRQLEELIKKIALAPELQDPRKDGPEANSDRIGPFIATAVMFPWACRELLLPKLQEGKVTLEQIAERADIPLKYVVLAMSEFWPEIYEAIMNLGTPERRS